MIELINTATKVHMPELLAWNSSSDRNFTKVQALEDTM
jgi:hypothetical protein